MDIENTLVSLGLDDKQIKVYFAALELGSATIQELAKKSGVKRTSIYNFLDAMRSGGLVTTMEHKGKLLVAAQNPEIFLQRSREKVSALAGALPQLLSIYNVLGDKPKIYFYEGLEGLKQVYVDTLTTGKTIYAFTDYEGMFDVIESDYVWQYPAERAKRKIMCYGIANDGPRARAMMKKNKAHWRELKLAPGNAFATEISIYGDKVAAVSFKRPYTGIIIQNRAIAETLKAAWKLLWERLA